MALIPEASIKALRVLKEEGYSDTFTRLVYTPASGSLGFGKPTYPAGKSYSCRYVGRPTPDELPGTDVVAVDGDLHFGRDVVLLPNDRITITHLHGDVVTPLVYDIIAGPFLDSLGQRASIKLVQE